MRIQSNRVMMRFSKIASKKLFKTIRNVVILLVVLAAIGALLVYLESLSGSPRAAAEKIRSLGVWGPLVVIVIVALEVVVAPIPGFVIAVASGYAFGGFWGAIYSYIGNIVGTAAAFFISRRFGRPLVERFVDKNKLYLYDCFFRERGRIVLWLVFLFPVFPTDIISFVTGLSDIKWKDFMVIVSVAYLPNMFLINYFGAALYESGLGEKTLILGSALLFMLLLGVVIYALLRKKAIEEYEKASRTKPL